MLHLQLFNTYTQKDKAIKDYYDLLNTYTVYCTYYDYLPSSRHTGRYIKTTTAKDLVAKEKDTLVARLEGFGTKTNWLALNSE
jgi:hypothetical protein